jgi:hypothetical protein
VDAGGDGLPVLQRFIARTTQPRTVLEQIEQIRFLVMGSFANPAMIGISEFERVSDKPKPHKFSLARMKWQCLLFLLSRRCSCISTSIL